MRMQATIIGDDVPRTGGGLRFLIGKRRHFYCGRLVALYALLRFSLVPGLNPNRRVYMACRAVPDFTGLDERMAEVLRLLAGQRAYDFDNPAYDEPDDL